MNIAISIGHGKSKSGGYDSGAVGGGYHEFKIARQIGKYAVQELKNYGCTVDLINYDADKYLTDRIAEVNKGSYDLALEIHLNAGGGTGSEVYYSKGDSTGKKLAGAISKSIADKFEIKDRGAKVKINTADGTDYFGFVRSCKCRSLLVETVFIDTASDRKKVETDAGQQQCGQAIAEAVATTYGLKKTVQMTATTTNTTAIKVGDKVKITGKKYATGQTVPDWVKKQTYTVKSVSAEKALLGEITSWVYLKDLAIVTSGQTAIKTVAVGSKVKIKSGAVYGGCTSARGTKVPKEQLAPKVHTVGKIQNNRGTTEALLKEISSWVALSSLEEV